MTAIQAYLKTIFNLLITCLMWLYFTAGFALLFSWFYAGAMVFTKNRELAFQRLNHYFFRGFFFLLQGLAPYVKWIISEDIGQIKSSVVVCNHVSYLDPLLLIMLFPRHKTIVKNTFFSVPLFGWLMRQSGFIPAAANGSQLTLMIERIESLEDYLASGGILFIFPEGTRSRDGSLGRFRKGAFKIAGYCQAPVQVLRITGTNQLFTPGKFLFNASVSATITLEKLGLVEQEDQKRPGPLSETMSRVRALMEQ